jgi:hypothetical protein
MCKWLSPLTTTTTIALYHNLLECCQVLFKIFKKRRLSGGSRIPELPVYVTTSKNLGLLRMVFKQKMLSRVRRKRLNIPPGCVAAGQEMV